MKEEMREKSKEERKMEKRSEKIIDNKRKNSIENIRSILSPEAQVVNIPDEKKDIRW